jgi:hypothetical protein
MLAVCFTRCDAISAIVCWMLNDTSVLSAHACTLHTLLDVIPRDSTAHARISAYPLFPIASLVHVCWFGSTQGYNRDITFSNVQANFLCF